MHSRIRTISMMMATSTASVISVETTVDVAANQVNEVNTEEYDTWDSILRFVKSLIY